MYNMTKFNKAHSIFISKIHSLPGELELFLKVDGDDDECRNAETLSFNDIISRFKVITKDFPRPIDYEHQHFQKSLEKLPYPVIDRALSSLIDGSLGHVWKLHQIDGQFIPLAQKIIAAFPEIIDLTPTGKDLAKNRLISSFTFFTRCSLEQNLNEEQRSEAYRLIEKAALRMASRYDARYDNLPKEYSTGFLQTYAHIKAIAFVKRQKEFFKSD